MGLNFIIELLNLDYSILEIEVIMKNRVYGSSMYETFKEKTKYLKDTIKETSNKIKMINKNNSNY